MRAVGVITLLAAVLCVESSLPEGYIPNKANNNEYKVVYEAQPWLPAQETCVKDNAHLAVPKSEDEFKFLQDIVRKISYSKIQGASKRKAFIWVGVNNLGDYRTWRNLYGESVRVSGYKKWQDNHIYVSSSADPAEPHCAIIEALHEGYRAHGCENSQSFICQREITESPNL